jgi:hypothetical protein
MLHPAWLQATASRPRRAVAAGFMQQRLRQAVLNYQNVVVQAQQRLA